MAIRWRVFSGGDVDFDKETKFSIGPSRLCSLPLTELHSFIAKTSSPNTDTKPRIGMSLRWTQLVEQWKIAHGVAKSA